MKPSMGLAALIFSLLAFPLSSPAFDLSQPEKFHSGISLQGFTGILNTPSAHLTSEGSLYGMYTNQKENEWRGKTSYQDNFFFSVGFFSVAEVGGRLTHAPGVNATDLSANFKVSTAPFFSRNPYVPVLAFGIQDVGGGAKFLQTKYVVASDDIWRLRLSAGYGNGPDRMKGLFGGAEFKALEWAYLLGEYDTRETNVGLRVVTPQFWKIPVSFTATAKTSLSHSPGTIDIALGFTFPLDFRVNWDTKMVKHGAAKDESRSLISPDHPQSPFAQPSQRGDDIVSVRTLPIDVQRKYPDYSPVPDSSLTTKASSPEPPEDQRMTKLSLLRDRLVKAGFMNVRVGEEHGRLLFVEYENVTFNHNELDALGVVSGMAADALKNDYQSMMVVIKKKNIRMLQVSMPLSTVAAFMDDERNLSDLKESISIKTSFYGNRNVSFVAGDDNPSMFSTSFLLWPGLTTMVGTEEGAFDYVLSLKPELYVNLWKGAMASARWDIPLSWSDNMDDGKPFRDKRTPSRMERLMLFQGIRLFPDVMANLGAGMLAHDLYGTMNELVWQPGDGSHRIRLVQSWGWDDKARQNRESYLASYLHYFSPLDVSLEGRVGKFWAQDKGFMLELKRFFGDTAFSVYYKNTTIREWSGMSFEAAGVEFSFPLTLRKDMKHYYKMQARGTDEWYYGRETVISTSLNVDHNYVPPVPLAATPQFTGSLHNQYLNRDRLSGSYIRSHLKILRDAWAKYRECF